MANPETGGDRSTLSPDRPLPATARDVPDLLAFYCDELATRGWHEVRTSMWRRVNGVPGPEGAVSAWSRGIHMPALLVGVVFREDGPGEFRLPMNSDWTSPCRSGAEQDAWNGPPPPMGSPTFE